MPLFSVCERSRGGKAAELFLAKFLSKSNSNKKRVPRRYIKCDSSSAKFFIIPFPFPPWRANYVDESKMVCERKNPNKNLNPNWAQLLEKLKNTGANTQITRNAKNIPVGSTLGKRKERSNEDSDTSKPDPLIPTSSDCSLTDMLAMDCEMVGVSLMGNKSALGRVTVVNKWGNVVYDEYVRPVDYVVDFRTQISGIRPHDLRKAKNFIIVQKKVAELIKGRILVGHALRNDLKALLLSHPKKDIRDTSEFAPFLKEGRSRSLKNLAMQFLGAEIQNGEHCPVEDARAAMLLYQNHRKQWERSIKDFSQLKEKQKKRRYKKKPKTSES